MPILEISSLEYLRTRSNAQIKADFIDYLRMGNEGESNIITAAYRRLRASEPVPPRKKGEKPERHEYTTFKFSDRDPVFVSMMEALRVAVDIALDLPWAQAEACRMKIEEGRTYIEIGKRLRCHPETASAYVNKALIRMVEKVRRDAEEQAKRDAKR